MVQDGSHYYRLETDRVVAIGEEELTGPGVRVGYLTLDGLRRVSAKLGLGDKLERDFTENPSRLRNSIDVYDDASIGVINIINMENPEADRDRIAFVLMKDLFLLAEIEDKDNSVVNLIEDNVRRFRGGKNLERFIYGIFERLLSGSTRMLEDMEQAMMDMELWLLSGEADRRLNRTIYNYRKRLAVTHHYLEHLIDIAEELQEDENELFDRDSLFYFGLFVGKAERISNSVQAMSDNAVHLRESLDAVLNYNLNQIMKVLTVVTAIFMPLTLIVGWYGMNFKHMPELNHPWAYPALLVVFVLIVWVCVRLFKRHKLL